MHKTIQQMVSDRKWSEVLPLAEQFRDTALAALGEEHPVYATSLNSLGLIYRVCQGSWLSSIV